MLQADAKSPRDRLMGWLIAAVVLLAWGGALQSWFASDDFLWLDISRPASVLASFSSRAGVIYDFRPIVRISYLLDWFLWGDQALGWHLINLALHGACAWLGWRLIMPWLGAAVAFWTVLIFAAMPVLQENVVWISGRTASLGLLFGLLSLLGFRAFLRTRRWLWLGASVMADLAALASYEAMILLPLIHLSMAYDARMTNRRQALSAGLIMLAAQAVLFAYRGHVLREHSFHPGAVYQFRPISIASLISLYHDYGPYHAMVLVAPWLLAPGVLALLARRNRDLARAAGLVLLITLLAFAPFMVFTGAASRYFYTGSLGIALLCGILLQATRRMLPLWFAPKMGLGLIALAGVWILQAEIAQARAETRDWVAAGALGQSVIGQIRTIDPNPNPEALHVVLGMPTGLGNGELFFTSPERAVHRFTRLPIDALVATHELRGNDAHARRFMGHVLEEQDEFRARARLPLPSCLDRLYAATADINDFFHRAPQCGLDVWQIQDGMVRRVDDQTFFDWWQNRPGR